MQYNYFPGRLRFRDPVLRDSDIRNAALEVVHLICPQAEITYKESTASILAVYPADEVNPDEDDSRIVNTTVYHVTNELFAFTRYDI